MNYEALDFLNYTKDEVKSLSIKKEEKYVQKVRGFYLLLALAIVNLVLFFFIALKDSDSEGWGLFVYILVMWIFFLGIYSFISFDFFGEEWKQKIIYKKFKKKSMYQFYEIIFVKLNLLSVMNRCNESDNFNENKFFLFFFLLFLRIQKK